MDRVRGILMVVAACVAFWKGWRIHNTGHSPLLACGLGVLALALAAWHLTRRLPQPRI
jgi:hypothetical protein